MKITIRKMGNSQGIIIPKPVLAQAGLDDEAEIAALRKAPRRPRRSARGR